MTTPQLLQQAKQGDPDAIAQLMNQSLETKGIKATVSRGGDRLRVLLKSENELNQSLLTQFIHKGIQNLNIPSINAVEVVGQSQAANPWSQTLRLQAPPAPVSAPPAVPVPPAPPVNVVNVAASPEVSAPVPPIVQNNIAQDDLELPAAALDDDFSLDDELSLAEIDQIVADAVKEVTTKIQSEIPFDPNADEESVTALYGPPGTYTSTPLSEAEVPMDEAIRQAVQANDLDKFIDQELAPPDAVTTIEPDGGLLDDGDSAQPSAPDPTVHETPVNPISENGGPSPNPDDIEETPVADRVNSELDEETAQTASVDGKSASKILLTVVSLLTCGAIAALVGYSVRNYALAGGNILAFPPPLSEVPEDAANDETNANSEAEPSDAGTNDTDGEAAVATGNDAESGSDAANSNDAEADAGDAETPDPEVTASETADAETATDGTTADNTNSTGDNANAGSSTGSTGSSLTTQRTLDAAIATVSCPVVLGGSDVTITQVEINTDVASAGNAYPLVGCLTNHTDAPIISAVIKYQGQPTEAAADIVPQDEWSLSSTNEGIGKLTFAELPPKSTAVFIAELPVAAGTSSIDLKSLAWRPEGWDGDAKQMTLGFSMPLDEGN